MSMLDGPNESGQKISPTSSLLRVHIHLINPLWASASRLVELRGLGSRLTIFRIGTVAILLGVNGLATHNFPFTGNIMSRHCRGVFHLVARPLSPASRPRRSRDGAAVVVVVVVVVAHHHRLVEACGAAAATTTTITTLDGVVASGVASSKSRHRSRSVRSLHGTLQAEERVQLWVEMRKALRDLGDRRRRRVGIGPDEPRRIGCVRACACRIFVTVLVLLLVLVVQVLRTHDKLTPFSGYMVCGVILRFDDDGLERPVGTASSRNPAVGYGSPLDGCGCLWCLGLSRLNLDAVAVAVATRWGSKSLRAKRAGDGSLDFWRLDNKGPGVRGGLYFGCFVPALISGLVLVLALASSIWEQNTAHPFLA
ncbi:hypothetical protein SODALDRAFT_61228 [Sodiomyces alkalinus F11]|uniref:Uncharacterized protein n=1 Tax=Sodiomyces alkalinus (strain CBS 110278 / VKM F-3762 / F11) TaxID=1314773 RepID=A0A3N2PLS6_SODAK|nr:hypothetical protein SODALDRAFT_61228 [Sodiomyces alkalinus F11]ROT35306.1 hypothetical protein SODALDRAFT_61228 [Sodiomyces alkalinus F11]